MIVNVSLRLLYLIFIQLLGWLLLLARPRLPGTSSCSTYATRSPYSAGRHGAAPGQHTALGPRSPHTCSDHEEAIDLTDPVPGLAAEGRARRRRRALGLFQ
ncbi:MAG TPA: hypothetical protein VGE94_18280 [Chloroflexota bacterium]|jgi:hypothetical protein